MIKKLLLIFMVIFESSFCFASAKNVMQMQWRELDIDTNLILNQTLELPTANSFKILKNTKMLLKDIIELSQINVELFVYDIPNCKFSQNKSDIEIISEVGVQLEQNCKLNIFVELKDVFKDSFFITEKL